VRSFHNAFRRDISQIDDSVLAIVRSGGDLTASLDRFHIFGEMLDIHAKSEEKAVFPALENVAPLVATAYLMDHRELDTMVSGLEDLRKSPDPLSTARTTAVLRSHLTIHLHKEDVHLYPILKERTTESQQASIVGLMGKTLPPEKFPMAIQWLFPLLDLDDRVAATNVWMSEMPPQVFNGLKLLIKKTVAEDWVELARRIPELDDQ
jgi:iron-sulfur cluster repair protein YtfE (RIC family)